MRCSFSCNNNVTHHRFKLESRSGSVVAKGAREIEGPQIGRPRPFPVRIRAVAPLDVGSRIIQTEGSTAKRAIRSDECTHLFRPHAIQRLAARPRRRASRAPNMHQTCTTAPPPRGVLIGCRKAASLSGRQKIAPGATAFFSARLCRLERFSRFQFCRFPPPRLRCEYARIWRRQRRYFLVGFSACAYISRKCHRTAQKDFHALHVPPRKDTWS